MSGEHGGGRVNGGQEMVKRGGKRRDKRRELGEKRSKRKLGERKGCWTRQD
jgi:hypothetical protein